MTPKEEDELLMVLSAVLQAQELIDKGYRRISNKYCMLSRIDRADWRKGLAKSQYYGKRWVEQMEQVRGQAEDHYRRCYSNDRITVSREVFQLVPLSNGDPVGFVP